MGSTNVCHVLVLLVVLCSIMARTAVGFWVAPMWGNKQDSVEYGRSKGTPLTSNTVNLGYNVAGGKVMGEANGMNMKYPGWVSRKQGMPFSNSFGKRYGRYGRKSVWSILFECQIDSSKCLRDQQRHENSVYP